MSVKGVEHRRRGGEEARRRGGEECNRVLVFVRENDLWFGLTELSPFPQHQRPRSPNFRRTSSAVGPAPCRLRASPADHPSIETTLLQTLISTTRTLRCIKCIIPKLGTRIISDRRCSPLHPRLLQIASVERLRGRNSKASGEWLENFHGF